jgi:hypothetical protein
LTSSWLMKSGSLKSMTEIKAFLVSKSIGDN